MTTSDTRAHILDAAERLFAELGFDAAPTARIAQTAGVPKGLLFYYFPTKTDLLRALVGERLALDPIDTKPFVTIGDPARSLLDVTRRLHDLQDASEVRRVIVWREQGTHPEVRARLREYRAQLQGVIERVLGASLLHPIAARRVRTAAAAWVSIITATSSADPAAAAPTGTATAGTTDHPEGGAWAAPDEGATTLPAFAELISAGLREPAA